MIERSAEKQAEIIRLKSSAEKDVKAQQVTDGYAERNRVRVLIER